MGALSDAGDVAGELYAVPPGRFVATRDELARQARTAGNDELARELRALRRPTQSAWLVNVLARRERRGLERLFGLGRELRRAQTQLDGPELVRLSKLRGECLGTLISAVKSHAALHGVRPSPAVLGEVDGTLRAGLADLAAAATVLGGQLVRPMSHSGFGPAPHLESTEPRITAPPPGRAGLAAADPGPVEEGGWRYWPAGQPSITSRQPHRPGPGRARLRPVPADEPGPVAAGPQPPPAGEPVVVRGRGPERIPATPAELAAAEAAHATRRTDLAAAEAALDTARGRLQWLDRQHAEARREKTDAERRVADAQLAEREAARRVADARPDG